MPEGGSKTSTVPIVWANFGIFSARSKRFPVGHNCWPWTKPGYITMSRRRSNQCSGDIACHPTTHSPAPQKKFPECKKPMENFSPRFFGIKTASASLIIFQRAELSTWSVTHLCWLVQLKDILKEKRRGKVAKGVLFLHDNAPSHRALATQKKLAYLGFHRLDHTPILRIVSLRTTTCSLGWKKFERSPFFFRRGYHCCREDLFGRTTFWFFSKWLAKVRTTG